MLKSSARLVAKGAAAKLFETIDRVPAIDSADQGGLRPESCEGNLSLDRVSFSYPSRPGVQVLSEVSVVRLAPGIFLLKKRGS